MKGNVEYCKLISQRWIQKSYDALDSAKIECENGHYAFAVNRQYYAVFYAASAILAIEDKSYGKHSAVRAALHRGFVRTGKIPIELGKLYDRLFENRQEADYEPMATFKKNDVDELMDKTVDFVNLIKKLLEKLYTDD
jgi:uncharacterized protein (UPF0332 family)